MAWKIQISKKWIFALKNSKVCDYLGNVNFPHFFCLMFICQFAISRIFFDKRVIKISRTFFVYMSICILQFPELFTKRVIWISRTFFLSICILQFHALFDKIWVIRAISRIFFGLMYICRFAISRTFRYVNKRQKKVREIENVQIIFL